MHIDEGTLAAHGRASISARPRTRKAPWRRAPISRRRSRSRAATTFSCSPTNAIRRSMAMRRRLARSRRPTPGRGSLRQRRRLPVALQALGPARACGRASSPATPTSSPPSAASATSPARKCRFPSSMSRSRPGAMRSTWSRAGRSTARISTWPTPFWAPATAIGGPGGAFFLWLNLADFGGRRGGGDNPLERVWCQSAAGSLSRASGARRGQSRAGLRQGRARA